LNFRNLYSLFAFKVKFIFKQMFFFSFSKIKNNSRKKQIDIQIEDNKEIM